MKDANGSRRLIIAPISGWIAIIVATIVGGLSAKSLGGAAVGASLGGASLGVSVLMARSSETLSGRRLPARWLTRAIGGLLVGFGAVVIVIIVDAIQVKGHVSSGLWCALIAVSLTDGVLATYGWLQM